MKIQSPVYAASSDISLPSPSQGTFQWLPLVYRERRGFAAARAVPKMSAVAMSGPIERVEDKRAVPHPRTFTGI